VASDANVQDIFGSSVAVSGDAALVGAPGDDDNGSASGSAYVFRFNGFDWIQEAKLLASDGSESDSLGSCVALAGDTAVAGAAGDDDNGADSGSAYVFAYSDSNWIEQDKLQAPDADVSDCFGQSAAISGNVMVVGAPGDDDKGSGAGSAYVFRFDGANWVQQAKLLASDGDESDAFGDPVAVSGDTIVVGAQGSDSVYVFRYASPVWVQEAKLLPCDCGGGNFSSSVAVTDQTILVGASLDDRDGVASGSVYVFKPEPSAPRLPVIAYYPNFAPARLPIADIRYDRLTHILYFSLSPKQNGDLDYKNVDLSDQQELVAHAHANGVKVLISAGGAGRCTHFSTMAGNPAARENFVAKLTQYCLEHNLEGADLDWEPVYSEADRNSYSALARDLNQAFEPHALMLTIAVGAFEHEIVPQAIGCFDWLSVMAYDDTPPHHSTMDRATSSLSHWQNKGAPRERLLLGVPFYGRNAADYYYWYRYIIDTYDPPPEADYIGGIGFNGVETIRQKTEYVVDNGYAGIMIWELSLDTTDESSLLDTIYGAIPTRSPADFDLDLDIDLTDFSMLVLAWLTGPDDVRWNYKYDISDPQDYTINNLDLDVFSQEWLSGQ
jgi:hypothetical protein